MQCQRIALMSVSTAYVEDDPAAGLVEARLRASGAQIAARSWVTSTETAVRAQLVSWISAPAIDGVIVCGESADVAAAAVKPLVTEVVSGGVLCGKKIVFVLPSMLGALADQLDRVVLPGIAARGGVPVARTERIETDKIAVIGDLPPPADVVSLNLRASGRRGLQLVALAGVAVAGGLCALAVNVLGRHDAIAVHHGAADGDVVAAPAAQPAPRPAVPAPPVVASRPPPPAAASHTPRPPAADKAPRPAPRVAAPAASRLTVPPILQAEPDDDDTCSEESCARHGNERECCTPFRAQAAALDHAHIVKVTSALGPTVRDCRTPGAADGLVRVSVQVEPDGSVGKALVLEAPETDVGSCVAAILRETSFPATDQGGSFVYRIELADQR